MPAMSKVRQIQRMQVCCLPFGKVLFISGSRDLREGNLSPFPSVFACLLFTNETPGFCGEDRPSE
jgi:hypothetical protein